VRFESSARAAPCGPSGTRTNTRIPVVRPFVSQQAEDENDDVRRFDYISPFGIMLELKSTAEILTDISDLFGSVTQ
jgi:hypothetical protein